MNESEALADDIGELIITSSDESTDSDSIGSFNDSLGSESSSEFDSEDDEYTDSEEDSEDSEEEEEPMPLTLPEHACVYCNIYNPMCVAKVSSAASGFVTAKRAASPVT